MSLPREKELPNKPTKGKRLKRLLTNFSLMGASMCILLVIGEFLIRYVAPQELSGTWSSMSERGYIINKSSWESQHVRMGRKVSYRFNSHHMRGEEVDTTAYKILCLGDSFTFGWLLEEDSTYVSLLDQFAARDMKANIQFLNGGTGGWGAADYRDFLKEFGDEIQPDMVLVFFNGGDLQRSMNRDQFKLRGASLSNFKKRLDRSSTYQWLLEHSHLTQWLRTRLISSSIPAPGSTLPHGDKLQNVPTALEDLTAEEKEYNSKLSELGRGIFLEMGTWCGQRDVSFVVGSTGWFGYGEKRRPTSEIQFLGEMDSLMAASGGTNLNIASLTSAPLLKESDKYAIPIDQHPNEAGARLIATCTWARLHPLLDSLTRSD